MHFTINKTEMSYLISLAVSVAESNMVANLAAITMRAVDGEIRVAATDQKVTVRQSAAALVSEEGSICAPARVLGSIVDSLPDRAIDIYTKDNLLHIDCEKNRLTLPLLDSYDEILLENSDMLTSFSVDARAFISAVKRVSAFGDKNEGDRFPGVCLDCAGGIMHVVATDSYKIGTIAFNDKPYPDTKVFLPAFFVKYLAQVKPHAEEMSVIICDKGALFIVDDIEIRTTLLQQTFPNWQQVMRLPESSHIACSLPALKAAVNRIRAIKSDTVEFEFSPEDVQVAGYADGGSSSIECIAAEESEVAGRAEGYFATSLLHQALATLEGSQVHLEVYLASKPVIFSDESLTSLVMPVRKPNR